MKVKKPESEKLRKEESEKLRNESEKLQKNVVTDATIKELIKIKSLEEDKNATNFPNWFDKYKFKNILAIINSNTLNNIHKIGEFKYIDIKDLINKIKNNTIIEISAKKDLNTLNEIKNAGITKQKRRTTKQKELLSLFNDLADTILSDNTLKLESQEDDENEHENVNEIKNVNENVNENENENENVNQNDKTLMPSNEDDGETINKNNSDKIIELNNHLDKIIDK